MKLEAAISALVLLGSPGFAFASPTAKEVFAVARERASAWQADAELREVGAPVDRAGHASSQDWHFSYASKKAGKDLLLYVGANKELIWTRELDRQGSQEPFPNDLDAFVDSDVAMAEAQAHALPEGEAFLAVLAANCPAQSKEPVCWNIASKTTSGTVVFQIGAKSGKFLRKK